MSTLTEEGIKALLPPPKGTTTTLPPGTVTSLPSAPLPTPDPEESGGVTEPLLFDPDTNVNMDPFGPIQGTGTSVGEAAPEPVVSTTAPVTSSPVIIEPETTKPPASSNVVVWVGLVACVLVLLMVLVYFATRSGPPPPQPQSFI